MTKKTGKVLNCAECGKEFYASGWLLRETGTRQPRFCSRACKHVALRGKQPPWATPESNTIHSAGYVLAWAPNHPRASRGRVFEHILVAERILRRSLLEGEHVHHRDRNRQNNDPSNLLVLTSSEHGKLHARESTVESSRVDMDCQICGRRFKVWRSRISDRKYCSLACRHKSWGQQMAMIRKKRR